jgi:hypothetical protein
MGKKVTTRACIGGGGGSKFLPVASGQVAGVKFFAAEE